jgi:hypothetical protein
VDRVIGRLADGPVAVAAPEDVEGFSREEAAVSADCEGVDPAVDRDVGGAAAGFDGVSSCCWGAAAGFDAVSSCGGAAAGFDAVSSCRCGASAGFDAVASCRWGAAAGFDVVAS